MDDEVEEDNRITCDMCKSLDNLGYCRSTLFSHAVRYLPKIKLKRRCQGYIPGKHTDDKRTAEDRWGSSIFETNLDYVKYRRP